MLLCIYDIIYIFQRFLVISHYPHPPLASLFLVPGSPSDRTPPLPPQGPAPSGVSQVDPPPLVEPLEVTSDTSGPAEGTLVLLGVVALGVWTLGVVTLEVLVMGFLRLGVLVLGMLSVLVVVESLVLLLEALGVDSSSSLVVRSLSSHSSFGGFAAVAELEVREVLEVLRLEVLMLRVLEALELQVLVMEL
ncbi:unnamed protein product [Closterium sp. Yama58-4]|nr:unnamed protein product [Closterium sp. Yama58-4]